MEDKGFGKRFQRVNLILAVLIILVAGTWGMSACLLARGETAAGRSGEEGETPGQSAAPFEEQAPVADCPLDGVAYEIALSGQGGAQAAAPAVPAPSPAPQVPAAGGDYVLPDSSTRYYSRSELERMDKQQLYLARNEIYARLGRKFNNPDLDRYFRSKSWYQPMYEADAFDAKGDGVFNQYELANRNLIVEIENGLR